VLLSFSAFFIVLATLLEILAVVNLSDSVLDWFVIYITISKKAG